MSYLRQFTRKNERSYTKERTKQQNTTMLRRKVISSVTALGFMFNPVAALAADVTQITGSDQKPINGSSPVTNIYVQKMLDGNVTGINTFDQFSLKANDIANLYFNQQGHETTATNLVNLVNKRIDISGTVNAVKNNTIGGNLFFLSSNGMAVSKTGVINAGSLTVLTPTTAAFDNLMQTTGNKSAINESAINDMVANPASVALNQSGTITIEGSINTTNNIVMRSGHDINIGSATSTTASLKTGVTDFSALVNVKDSQGTVTTNAGLGNNLIAQTDTAGDIVLSAVANDFNVKDNTFQQTLMQELGMTDNNTIEGKVNTYGTIAANGNVTLEASASNAQERVAQTVAEVNVNGAVTGKQVAVTAAATNVFEDNDNESLKEFPLQIAGVAAGVAAVNVDADYAVLGSKANVNIGKDGSIEATGTDSKDEKGNTTRAVEIKAESTLGTQVGAQTSAFKLANVKHTNAVPASAVTYVEADNKAKVQVDGTVKSKDGTKIAANAKEELAADASVSTLTLADNPSAVNAAVLVVNGSNTADVNIGSTAHMQDNNLTGAVDIFSTAENSVAAKAASAGSDKAAISTALNITKYNSHANVDIASGVQAGGDVSIHADNIISQNTVTTSNAIGSTAITAKLAGRVTNSKTFNSILDMTKGSNSVADNLLGALGKTGKLGKKIQGLVQDPSTTGDTVIEKLGKNVSAGMALQYVDESNASGVTIHAVPVTSTDGNVSIASKTDVQDTLMNVVSATNNQQSDSTIKAAASGAVLISSMDNSSKTVIEGGTSDSHSVIKGKDVSITAMTKMPYNRVNKMVEGVLDAIQKVEDFYKGTDFSKKEDYTKAIADIKEAANDFKSLKDGDSFNDTIAGVGSAMSNLGTGLTELFTLIGKDTSTTTEAITTPLSVLSEASKFASTDQYANFYVRTVATEGDDAKSSKLAGAGSININSINNDSTVLIGKNASVIATRTLDTNASTVGKTVSFTGNASAFLLPAQANDAGVGASVAVENFSGDSLMLVAEGANLSGAAVNITADNDLNRTGIVYSAGTAGTTGLSGMVDVMVGDSNAITLVDDEAIVTASTIGTNATDGESDGSVTINASNNTVLTNIAGGLMKSEETAIGVGAAVTAYDVQTIAGVIDTDNGVDTTKNDKATTTREKSDNKIKAAQEAAMDLMTAEEKAALLGSSVATLTGGISGQKVNVNSTATGVINSIGVAGAVTSSDDSGEQGFFDKVDSFIGKTTSKISDPINKAIDKIDNYVSTGIDSKSGYTMNNAVNSGSTDQGASGTNTISQNEETGTSSSAHVSAAGSVAVNVIDGQTSVLMDKATITLKPDANKSTNGMLETAAADDLFAGTWAGGAAINWVNTTKQSSSNPATVAVGGAVAVNVANRDVASVLRNSTITNAGAVTNTATKSGADVAAALGVAVSKASGKQSGTNVAVGAAVSYNHTSSDVQALLIDDTIDATNGASAAISNTAYGSDIQVTGGINTAIAIGGKSGAGVGGSVVIGQITNNIEGGIYGGTYTKVQSVDTHSAIGTKQVAAGVGVAAESSSKGAAVEGVAVYNSVDNDVKGVIDGATITSSGTVKAEAYDTTDSANKHADYIKNRGLDADGSSYREAIQSDTDSSDSDQNYNDALTTGQGKTGKEGGNVIVTGALSVAGSGGNAGIGAAVAIDRIKNTMTTSITDANITAHTVEGTADTDTVLVGVAAGAAGSGKFGGAGSVSWQEVKNSAITNVENSTITTADKAAFTATNDMVGVNVAGQISAGKMAAGLALAYHYLDNTTGVYVKEAQFHSGATDGSDLILDAASNAKIFSVAAGVSAALGTFALNGTIAINRGANTTEAIIDGATNRTVIDGAKNIDVAASDDTLTTAIAGGVTAGSGTVVGAAIALNDIGGFSNDGEKSSQNIKAQINDTDITTVGSGASVKTDASDNAHMITVGVGIGASSQSAIQGSSATSLINKSVESSLNNTNIKADIVNSNAAKLETTASNDAKIVANATVIAAGSTAGVGAGLGVNRIVQTTTAAVNGGTQQVDNAVIKATGTPTIIATGVGGAGAGTTSIAGSFGVNIIDNSVKASISKATMASQGNIGVIAQSDEAIGNYAGAISGAGTVAVGLAAAVNTISGTTEAIVEDSTVSANGSEKDAIVTNADMDNNAIISGIFETASFVPTSLKGSRKETTHTGIVVDSSATHSISSVLASAGGSGTAAAMGAVNVNTIGGSTKATVSNTNINEKSTPTGLSDVTVKAADYTNSSGLVGAAVGSNYAAVGAVSDTNLVNRTTKASVAGNDTAHTVRAHDFTVNALSKQGLSNFDINVAVAAEGGGVGGTVTVDKLQSETTAAVDTMDVTFTDTAAVVADHSDGAYVANTAVGGAAIGAGVGLTVGVVHQDSKVTASVAGSTISSKDANNTTATVKATNTNKLKTVITSAGIGAVGAGVAGTTAVNNMKQHVSTDVSNSTIQAGTVDVLATNTTDISTNGGAVAGGTGGVGVSVSVNTFDDMVNTNVTKSTLKAVHGDVTVKAEENRNADQTVATVAAGGVAVGANIMVTNINRSIDNKDVKDKIDEANKANVDKSGNIIGLTADEKDTVKTTSTTNAATGSNDDPTGTHTKVQESNIEAMGTIDVDADEKTDVTMHGGSAAVGGASLNGSVGFLQVKHDTDVMLSEAILTGHTVNVNALQGDRTSGTSLNLYQGSAGTYALGAAYGNVNTSGTTDVVMTNTDVTAMDVANIQAKDTTSTAINAYGLTAGGVAAGAIVAQSANTSAVGVSLDSTAAHTIKATDGIVNIRADKNNKVATKAVGGAVGILAGMGIYATATDTGASSVVMNGKDYTLQAMGISLNATNTPQATVWAGGVAAGINSAQLTHGEANVNGTASLVIADDNTFNGDFVSLQAGVGDIATTTADVTVLGTALSGVAGLAANEAVANTDTKATVAIGKENYGSSEKSTGETVLHIQGDNNVSRKADMSSLTVGGLIASGNGIATTTGKDIVDVSANGGTVFSLELTANGNSSGDAYANGDGGGFAAISPEAAKATNTLTTAAKATLGGTWTADTVDVNALQADTSNMKATATQGGGIAVTGIKAETTINSADDGTMASIADGAAITAKTIDVRAANNITTGSKYDYSVDGLVWGAATINKDKTTQNITKTSTVNIGTAAVHTSGMQTYAASTTGNITNKINANAAGAVTGAVATNENTMNITNKVDTNGQLINRGDYDAGGVTLAAYDNLKITTTTDATTPVGVGGAISAETADDLTRNNLITLAGVTESARDLNLYAGADTKGAVTSLDMTIAAGAYNHTVIPLKTKPSLKLQVKENNSVNVRGSGEAIRHVNVTADGGKDNIRKETGTYSWIKGGKNTTVDYVGNADGDSDYKGKNTNNYVQVDGQLRAGIKHDIEIAISGTVVPNGLTQTDPNSRNEYTIIAKSDDRDDSTIRNGITYGTKDYTNILSEQWKKLCDLIDSYHEEDLTAYAGYLQEKGYIEEQMKKMGLWDTEDNIPVVGGYDINYVSLPNVTASGGNISVHSDNLKGSGILEANGSPSVSITNNSTAYLIVNSVGIGEKGGEVIYQEKSIANGGNTTIMALNKDKSAIASFSNVNTDDSTGAASRINIVNEYVGGNINVTDGADNGMYVPLSTIEIAGAINNPQGIVEINNKSGDIIIDAGNQASVNGKSMKMTAKGSIMQGYTPGIVNIGSTPEEVYGEFVNGSSDIGKQATQTYKDTKGSTTPEKRHEVQVTTEETFTTEYKNYLQKNATDAVNKYVNFLKVAKNIKNDNLYNQFVTKILNALEGSNGYYIAKELIAKQDDTVFNTSQGQNVLARAKEVNDTGNVIGSRIAGGSIYMAAGDINVNGTIQSGYSRYYANISDDDISKCLNNTSVTLPGQAQTVYKVNDGNRAVLQSDGSYAYEVQVYYDNQNKKLIVDDIDSQGGKINLTGRISSTGNGKILALDGGANITITNNSQETMNVGKVLNNDVEGIVTITDTNQNSQTIYKKSGTQTITDYANYIKKGMPGLDEYQREGGTVINGAVSSTKMYEYSPKTGLRYNWTEGTKTDTTWTYDYDKKKFLGLIKFKKETITDDIRKESSVSEPQTSANVPLPTGAYISTVTDASDYYTMIADNRISSDKKVNDDFYSWTEWHWFNKHWKAHWSESQGSLQTYVNSLKADNDISVGFIGQKDGVINITGKGDVNLNGNILNNTAAATLSVNASKAITQQAGTTLNGNDVSLVAGAGINNINITSMGIPTDDVVKLNAVTTTGNINVNVNSGFKDNVNLPGNVEINKLVSSGIGSTVSLVADGNITQKNAGLAVEGSRIDLTSTNGAIGTSSQAIVVQGGQEALGSDTLSSSVNSSAKGNIILTQNSGNMRVGTIASKEGDVILTAATGAFLDALPDGESVNNTDTDTLTHRWVDAGLIAGDATYTGAYVKKLQQNVTDYESTATQNFVAYQDLKTYYDAHQKETPSETYKNLKDQFGTATSVNEWLTAQASKADSAYAKLVAKRDHPTYEWTKDQLLYAVKDAIANKATGSTDAVKKVANVTGRNITLQAKAVGSDKAGSETISADNLANNLDNLKKLANAEASDVTVTKGSEQYTYTDETGDHIGTREYVKTFTIGGKVPFGVYATGKLNVTTMDNGHAYVAGRSNDKDAYAALNIGTINTGKGDIRLLGKVGVYNALTEQSTNFTGHDLILEGGKAGDDAGVSADIGTEEKAVTVDLSGELTARTDATMYIKNNNSNDVLRLGGMYAGNAMNLTSPKGFVMGDNNADTYVHVGNILNLNTTKGNIGTDSEALRILANGAVVNVSNANNVYLSGKLGTRQVDDSMLILGTVDAAGTIQADSEGSIQVGRDEVKDGDTVTVSSAEGKVVAGADSALSAAKQVLLNGSVAAKGKKLTLMAKDGAVTETNKGIVTSDILQLISTKGVTMQNSANAFNTVDVTGDNQQAEHPINGDVLVVTNSDALTAKVNNVVTGKVEITNLRQNGTMKIGADVTASDQVILTSDGNMTNENAVKSGKQVTMTAKNGSILNKGSVTSGEAATMTAGGAIENQRTVTSAGNSVTMDAQTGIVNNGDISAKTDVTGTTTTGDIQVSGKVTATEGSVNFIDKGGNIALDGDVTAEKGLINANAVNGSVTLGGNVIGGNTVTAKATEGNVIVRGSVTSNGGDTTLTATDSQTNVAAGNITVGGTIRSAAQAVMNAANGDIIVSGDVTGQTNVLATTTGTGNISINGVVKSTNAAVKATTETGNIKIAKTVDAKSDAVFNSSVQGNIDLEGAVTAGQNITAQTKSGAVTAKGNLLAGNAVQAVSNNGTVTLEGNVTATQDKVNVEATNGDAVFSGNVIAGTTVNARATEGNVIVSGSVTSNGGDTTLTATDSQKNAAAGNITVGGTIRSAAQAVMNAANGDITVSGDVTGQTNVLATTTGTGNISINGVVKSTNAAVKATTETGNIKIAKTVDAKSDAVFNSSVQGNIDLEGAVTAGQNITAQTKSGAVTAKGNLLAGNAVQAVSNNGTVTLEGNVTATQDKVNVEATNGDAVFSGNVIAGTTVNARATEGNVIVSGSVTSNGGDTTLTATDSQKNAAAGNITVGGTIRSAAQAVMNAANGDITVSGDVTGQTNVLATTTGTGNISINGVVKSTNAAVKATTETGNIKIAKTVDAKSDAVFNSSVQGNIDLEGEVTAGQNITAQTKSGAVTAKGNLLAGNAVQAVSNNGTVTLEGNVTATQDKVNVEATNGDAVFSGNVTAGTIVNARATEGNVIVSGSVTSNGGDTTLTATDSQKNVAAGNITVGGTIRSAAQAVMNAANGDITVSGDVTGQTNVLATTTGTGNISIDGVVKSTNAAVKATTETGNITIGGNVAAGTDLIAQTVNGNIGFNGTVTTGNDMTAQTIDNGNIIFNGAVNVGNNLLADAVKTGGITLRQNITAGQNLTMHTNDGTILLEGNNSNVTEDVVATAKNGDINITVTGTGDVKDTHRTVNGDRGFVKSEKGNVIIDHQGKGIVDLYEVFAKKEARIATKDGDLYLNNVDGNLVALIVRNPEKKMDVKHITAGTEVAFNGADISVDNISQRPESEGVLAITLKGASDDVPVDRLHLGDIQTNSGVRFKQVWLKNGDISVTKGDFILDKLYILDKATFSNGTMTTNVFGTAPIPEETITSTYWNNTKINNPKEDLANWFRDGQNNKWMNLRFDGQKNVQFSNGNLLSLLPHNYVYNERYTQETWSRIFQDRDYYNFYGHYYNPDVSFHNRYDLIEVQGPGVSNAKPADIVIQ